MSDSPVGQIGGLHRGESRWKDAFQGSSGFKKISQALSVVIARSEATKQSILSLRQGWIASLALAMMV
jgi:hypothetical protein